MRKITSTLFLLSVVASALSQSGQDSLYRVWQDATQSDSMRVSAYNAYIWDGFLFSDPDSAFILAQAMYSYGDQHHFPRANAHAYQLMGLCNHVKSDYPKALDYYQRAMKIYKEIGHQRGLANAIGNIGIVYHDQGDYARALDNYQRSLKIKEEIGDEQSMAGTIVNIGNIYRLQDDFPRALDYYQRGLVLYEKSGDKQGMSNIINNKGLIYDSQGDITKALECFEQCLKISEETGDQQGLSNTILNIGSVYQKQGDFVRAMDYYQRSLKIKQELGDQLGTASVKSNIGNIYYLQGNYSRSLQFCEESRRLSQEIQTLEIEKDACKCLYDTYKALGKGNEALVYMERIQVIDDSLNAGETAKKLQQMEFAKVILQDSLAKAEEARIIEMAHHEEMRQEKQVRNWTFVGGVMFLLLAGGFYSRWRNTRKAKAIIEREKDRSENLLLNILPADIAAELKEKGRADARNFDLVSIIFTDFKGFTATSEQLSAQDLVSEINACFEAFDGIMGKYGIEKIKTIGDAYMAAGGLPVPSDDAVKNSVLAALDMQTFITRRKAEHDKQGKPCFEMRVGIHTGPVVAGIVGVKKFQYDIWGDTVNTASRLESNSEAGKVNISQATYDLLKEDPDFRFEHRGKIDVKGKGEIDMYFVEKNQET